MATWEFEPGHTAAEFAVRHMMVTYVRGHFKNIHGSLDFDPDNPADGSVRGRIDATTIWTGEAERDAHLRTADFLDVERFPTLELLQPLGVRHAHARSRKPQKERQTK